MLKEIDQDIWVAEQPLRYFGLSMRTRMTIIRLANPELAVISPIKVSDVMVNQLAQLGTVKHIIAPNLYHYFFAADFKSLYPAATFWAAPGLKEKQPELSIDRVIESTEDKVWDGLEFALFYGFRTLGVGGFESLNECVFFHAASRTLILTDTAFHFDDSFPMITQLAMRVLGSYKCLGPSFLERIATTDKERVKASVKQILTWDFDRVIVAHGSIVEKNGQEKLRQGYEIFLGSSVSIAA